jgi:nucleotide-binding universal stress UspA family protein
MRILLAVDGSRYLADVVDALISRPWPEGSSVRVLSAVEPEQIVSVESRKAQQRPMKATEELVEFVAASLASHGFRVGTVVKPGDPREVIVNEAENWQAHLIVMGAYGHSGVRNWQLGSVAESVANHARCSVELIRKTKDAGNPGGVQERG